ncbi:MAG: hypothetical protein P8182_06415, partial [Deltaproteobacteria bacterium]
LLGGKQGGLQGVPEGAKVIPFLNKLDLMDSPGQMDAIAKAVAMTAGDRISRMVAGAVKGSIRTTTYAATLMNE